MNARQQQRLARKQQEQERYQQAQEQHPLPGVPVTFAAISAGVSGTFPNGAVTTVTTDGSGVAEAPPLTANGHPGTHRVEASVPGVFTPVVFSLTNQAETDPDPMPPSLVFLPLILRPEIVVPDATPTGIPDATPTSIPDATATPVVPDATPTPTVPPPSFVSCAVMPDPTTAPHYPIRIVTVDKPAESVTLQNMTTTEFIDLTNWIMCSIRGGQTHRGISGTLAPGETRTFVHTGGNIWNNRERDPEALYDPEGRLISFWADE